jgi:hypothetical protein
VSVITSRKSLVALRTVMPLRTTSGGSWGCAMATRFCTSTWSMFLSVPISKVTVRL